MYYMAERCIVLQRDAFVRSCAVWASHFTTWLLNDVRVLAPASQQESTPQQHRPEDMTGTLVYKACM